MFVATARDVVQRRRGNSVGCGYLAIGLLQCLSFACGKGRLQIPFANWATGRDRVDDAAKGYAFGIDAGSHF